MPFPGTTDPSMVLDMRPQLKWAGRSLLGILSALAVCAFAPAAASSPKWWPAERLPSIPATVSVAPNGAALLFGFPDSLGHSRTVFRPAGGSPGSPRGLPGPLGYPTGTQLLVGWFPDGSALIANPGADMLSFRPSGAKASVGAPQNLGPGEGPAAIATNPSGTALIGLAGNNGVGVAFRSSGAKGSVAMSHAKYFGPGAVLGVALDPSGGGAMIAWTDAVGTLKEAVRNPARLHSASRVSSWPNPIGWQWQSIPRATRSSPGRAVPPGLIVIQLECLPPSGTPAVPSAQFMRSETLPTVIR